MRKPARYRTINEETRRRAAASVVYFVLAEGANVIKIGTAEKVGKRLAALEAGSPVPLKLRGTIGGGEQVERWCHYHCFKDRSHYEWFHWTPRVRSFVDLVLSHGATAAEILCPRERRADLLLADGRPAFGGHLDPMPQRNSDDDGYLARIADRVTPLSTCSCESCAAYLGAR